MIADLKPYAEYKESGSRWLAKVPSHWEVRKLRTLIRPRNERNRPELPLLSVAREKGVFVRSLTDADENHNVIPEDLSNYKVARAGSLVINKMKAWQGSMGIAPSEGIVSPAYFVFDFDIADRAFGQALLRSKPYVAHFGQASDGVRVGQWDLTIAGMRQIPVLAPPPDEQAAIVRFLDWANGRLERAIRAKRKVIALLNEQKQAIIHRAVTRGLDPSVPLRPSGIFWLGKVPKHWEIAVAKRVCSVFIPQRDKPELNEIEGIPWVTLENLGKVFVKPSRFYVRDRAAQAVGSRTVPSGSVLASCVGRFGITSITAGAVVINQQIQAFIPGARLSKFFLRYSVMLAKPYFEMQGNSTTLPYVDREGFGAMPLLIPPLPEQEAIVQHLKAATAKIDAALSRLEREIDLLREYRTRLVADVVTGKLDVREAAAQLPEEAAPDTAEDGIDLSIDPEAADEEAVV